MTLYSHVGGGGLLNHHQCAASTCLGILGIGTNYTNNEQETGRTIYGHKRKGDTGLTYCLQ